MDRTDNKITLCKIRFNLGASKILSQDEVDSLSDTARNFFWFIQAFGIKLKLRNFVNIWMVEDRLRDLDSRTCGIFQFYFFDNLFTPDENIRYRIIADLTEKLLKYCLINSLLKMTKTTTKKKWDSMLMKLA